MATRVGLYFREDKQAVAVLQGGDVMVYGSEEAHSIVDFYRQEASGHELLDLLLRRVKSQWWAADESAQV